VAEGGEVDWRFDASPEEEEQKTTNGRPLLPEILSEVLCCAVTTMVLVQNTQKV